MPTLQVLPKLCRTAPRSGSAENILALGDIPSLLKEDLAQELSVLLADCASVLHSLHQNLKASEVPNVAVLGKYTLKTLQIGFMEHILLFAEDFWDECFLMSRSAEVFFFPLLLGTLSSMTFDFQKHNSKICQ